MGIEFELKYRANPTQQAALLERFAGQGHSIAMETTYYDTPDRFLSTRHITLRRRMENGVSVCTVKTPLDTHGRGEWETQCPEIDMAIGELCKLGAPEALKQWVAPGLVMRCGARFTRLAKTIDAPGCTVELALDSGILLGGGREAPLCEIEVELKSGSAAAAVVFAEELAAKFGLTSLKTSKFSRALALRKGE